MFLVILLYALIAGTFTLAKISVSAAHPLFFVGIRMILAGTALLIARTVMRILNTGFSKTKTAAPAFAQASAGTRPEWRPQVDVSKGAASETTSGAEKSLRKSGSHHGPLDTHQITGRDLFDFFQVILFHIFLAFVPEFWALTYMPSVKVTIFYSMTPFVAILLSYLIYGEKITRRQLLGIIVAFACILPLALSGNFACIRELAGISWPEAALAVSVLSATYAWFVIKRLMNRGYSLLTINGISMLAGGILTFFVWTAVRVPGISPVYAFKPFLFALVSLILVSNVIVYNLYGYLLTRYTVNALTAAGFLSPLFGALYGFLFLGECLFWYHAVAICGIAIGLTIFFASRARIK